MKLHCWTRKKLLWGRVRRETVTSLRNRTWYKVFWFCGSFGLLPRWSGRWLPCRRASWQRNFYRSTWWRHWMAADSPCRSATESVDDVKKKSNSTREVFLQLEHTHCTSNLWEHPVSEPLHPPHPRGGGLGFPRHHHPRPPGKPLHFPPHQLSHQKPFSILQTWKTTREALMIQNYICT